VIQRESIGSTKNKVELESELNRWISSLVTKMNNPSVELAATHPLKEGQVTVHDIPENPGFYSVSLHAIPHFQIEGMDVQLSMVAKLPTGKE
jgi:type VI secretion system protein ImpC